MQLAFFPQSTPYDPAEDPPGSVDPLGTIAGSEQLAEVLLPGLTARMWRLRLLTFAAFASEVARRVADGQVDQVLDARLAFERLFVSAVARKEQLEPSWKPASRRLPGIALARQALRSGDQPLGKSNFLKGQAVNGPFGVISRLARNVGVVDESGELGRAGTELLLAWSTDQNLPGLLDDHSESSGNQWLKKLVRHVASYLDDGKCWPKKNWAGWHELAVRLRPDEVGVREQTVIRKLLSQDPLGIRSRMIDCLAAPEVFAVYRDAVREGHQGGAERAVLVDGIRLGNRGTDAVGHTLTITIEMIDAYELLSGLLETAFRGLVWGLTRNHGQAIRSSVVQVPELRPLLAKTRSELGSATTRYRQRLEAFESDSVVRKRGSVVYDRMYSLLNDSLAASQGVDQLVEAVMQRHRRVQKEKGKGVWIDDDKQWTLMPGFGDTADHPLRYDWYLHPYRITNAYSMIGDLKLVTLAGSKDGEEQDE